MLQHIVYRRAGTGQLLIFDSHDHPARWPAGHVIGNGRNYQNIWKAAMAWSTSYKSATKPTAPGHPRGAI
jgi:hypothetical protein